MSSEPIPTPSNNPASPHLPKYIATRNANAVSSGLGIEKLQFDGQTLTTWFRGDEESWRRSSFCRRPREKPFPKQFGGRDFRAFSPSCSSTGNVFIRLRAMASGDYRGTIHREVIAEYEQSLPGAIEVYHLPTCFGAPLVYVGSGKELVDRKIAPPEMLTGRCWARAAGPDDFHVGEVLWNAAEIDDGRFVFTDYVGSREKAAKAKAERMRYKFASPTELLEEWRDCVGRALQFFEGKFSIVETQTGKSYRIQESSLNHIAEAAEALLTAIADARVNVRDTDPEAIAIARRVTVARTDGSFQTFLAAIGVERDPGSSG